MRSFYTAEAMLDFFFNLISRLQSNAYDPVAVVIELLLIGLCVNWAANVLQGTRGTRPLRGVLIVLIVATLIVRVLAVQMGWVRLELLYRYVLLGLAFIALVAFQPELRRAVIRLGEVRIRERSTPKSALITALVKAAGYLSKNKYGALIAIQRTVDLRGWAENGTMINAEASANLLNSIFFPNSPLHDLGVIIRDGRVISANCQFPSADSEEADTSLGSRHLAALGMSYETDALVLVVSEETGTISLADTGKLVRYLSLEDLAGELETRLGPALVAGGLQNGRLKWNLLRGLRRSAIVLPLTLSIWYLADQATLAETKLSRIEIQVKHDDPRRVAEVISPKGAAFTVTVRGPARQIDRLRVDASELQRQDWIIAKAIGAGTYGYGARQVIEELPGFKKLGLSVSEVNPLNIDLIVDDIVQARARVEVDAGATQIADVRVEPAEIDVVLRKRDADRLDPANRVIRARLENRLAQALPDQSLTFDKVALATDIGGVTPISISRGEVKVELRVVGQRTTKRLAGVPVRVLMSFDTQTGFNIERQDQMEWLIDVDVEGDRAAIDAVQPKDCLAYVVVTTDFAQPSADRKYRQAEVVISAPAGFIVKSPPRVVQLRLVPREAAP